MYETIIFEARILKFTKSQEREKKLFFTLADRLATYPSSQYPGEAVWPSENLPGGSGRIRADPGGSGRIRAEPPPIVVQRSPGGSERIRAAPGGSGRIRAL